MEFENNHNQPTRFDEAQLNEALKVAETPAEYFELIRTVCMETANPEIVDNDTDRFSHYEIALSDNRTLSYTKEPCIDGENYGDVSRIYTLEESGQLHVSAYRRSPEGDVSKLAYYED